MDVRTTFVISLGIILFTMYYLEKEMEREQIYWLFTGLSVLTGAGTVYLVAKKSGSYDLFITLTVLCIIIAILYHEGVGGEIEVVTAKKREKKRGKKERRKK
jgi:hypothetical protein